MAVADAESAVLDCYRLARFYQQSPEVFLRMPLSEVRTHMHWSGVLAERMREEQREENE